MYQNIIRLHDESHAVTKLQWALNGHFNTITVPTDGKFSPLVERTVREFQRREGLAVDGIVGPQTIARLKLDMTPQLLDEMDYADAARELNVTQAHIRAVAEVETRARPFWEWAGNKTPILYERHIFDRYYIRPRGDRQNVAALTAERLDLRRRYPDLCNPTAGGYGRESQQYPKLERAIQISETVALQSASWGTFQIMGFHAIPMGWHSVQAFARAMQASQSDHLRAFVRVIQIHPTWWNALKTSNWTAFARGYNGPAQKGYDTRMSDAFSRYRQMGYA